MVRLALDHVNIRTSSLAALRAFYVNALGLREGPRPPSSTHGVWLYTEEGGAGFARRPVVHLVEVDPAKEGLPEPRKAGGPAPAVSHFAFAGRDRATLTRRLTEQGVAFRAEAKPDGGGGRAVVRVQLRDPDGNEMHLDFPADEPAAPAREDEGRGEELTCGQELARAAEVPQQWAALMSHIAVNLERHAAWVGTDVEAARQEHEGMRAVAAAYEEMAASARHAADVLRAMEGLPAAPHDPAKRDLAAQTQWMREKLLLQRALATSLFAHAEEAETALATWTQESSRDG